MGDRVERLRQEALAKVRAGQILDALALYDEALSIAVDDEKRELLTINKADALISVGEAGPEIDALPRIVMRRRNSRHVYLAAYALQYKNRLAGAAERAVFYGQIALRAADEAGQPLWARPVYLELGNAYVADSRFADAEACYLRVLQNADESAENADRDWAFGGALESLGYCKIVRGDVEHGIEMLHEALTYFDTPFEMAETYLDLCYGYLEADDYERARTYGERGLQITEDARHIRNGHYLLGEVAFKLGELELAEHHFDELASLYPEFKNLKPVLYAFDLRGMINLKL